MKIEEALQKDGKILQLPVGTSMRPMLKNRQDPLVIGQITAPPQKYDVVLFRRADGQYVLHRIVKVRADHYVFRGDNCIGGERVGTDQVIGILQGFYKGDRYVDCNTDTRYKRYVWFWGISYPVRSVIIRLRRLVQKILDFIRKE